MCIRDRDKDAPSRRLVFAFKMPPNAKGVGLAKLWSGKQTKHNHRGQSQRQHSKTFTIDSDDEDENDYQRSDDDSDDDGRGNNNNQKRKGRLSSSSSKSTNVARAYQHKKKKKFYSSYTSQHEFSICRFLLVLIAIAFASIFLIERFAPKDVYIPVSYTHLTLPTILLV